ncbi:GFA family protein [Pseudovibrio exalbescens]|uniref:GFA family protein n=1 Tax=Pseudovibrio exalbescens TaxID=197461 RepID=UPI002365660D|nr:GFA family protein [Pseudovibrio exalbescens]MDD7910036.1 GFA family protein [Pseudovibrio exalbescens]
MAYQGGCLCGKVRYTANTDRQDLSRCHCKQCRQWGGAFDSLGLKHANLTITSGEELIKWYLSSDVARRGFCQECGTNLFWQADRHPEWSQFIAVSAGTLDEPTNTVLTKHIFCAHNGDYYEITDDLTQFPEDG